MADIAEILLRMARERLLESGWSISLVERDDHLAIKFEHELTIPFSLGFAPSPLDPVEALTRTLNRREFQVIARRPDPAPHGGLLRDLRVAARARQWTDRGVALLAQILADHEVLTESEAAWLTDAGAPWSEG